MLQNQKFFSGFSVKNANEALQFYRDKLGLNASPDEQMEGIFGIKDGETSIMVYEKENHEPATFTVLNFLVADVAKKVEEMKAAGIKFESYDTEDIKTDANNIFKSGDHMIAWFKDPSGNILSVLNE